MLGHSVILFFFFRIYLFIYLFIYLLAVLSLCCCARAFSSCGEWGGPLLGAVRGPLTAVAFPAAEHGLQVHRLQQLWHTDSVVVARGLWSAGPVVVEHGPSCSAVCGIFPDQGLNPHRLHWQADTQPLCHQGSPIL